MIEITRNPLSPELILSRVKTDDSGCVVTYVGLIRDNSYGKRVLSVEYLDDNGDAVRELEMIAAEIRQKWPVSNVAICHRTGRLAVGDINLVVAIAAAHRKEGFAASQYAIDQFKLRLPTQKIETYTDGDTLKVAD